MARVAAPTTSDPSRELLERDDQLSMLRDCVDAVQTSSRGRLVLIGGEAGVGKTGSDIAGESIPYIAGWGEDGALDAIHEYAETNDAIARRIEDAVHAGDDTSAGDDRIALEAA